MEKITVKLITDGNGNYSLFDLNNELLATTMDSLVVHNKLSIKNCQAIERGYDLDELADEVFEKRPKEIPYVDEYDFKQGVMVGFQKAVKLIGDKKFNEKDMANAVLYGMQKGLDFGKVPETDNDWVRNYIKSLQQTEWEVEIEMIGPLVYPANLPKEGEQRPAFRNKLDENGCLILKRI
jgi:hypothetical protein